MGALCGRPAVQCGHGMPAPSVKRAKRQHQGSSGYESFQFQRQAWSGEVGVGTELEGSAWASGLSPSMGEEPRALKRPFCLLWTQSYFLPEPLVYVIPGAHSDSQNSDSLSFDGSCTKRFTSISPPSALGADRVCTQGLVRGGAARGWGEGATCQTRPG